MGAKKEKTVEAALRTTFTGYFALKAREAIDGKSIGQTVTKEKEERKVF